MKYIKLLFLSLLMVAGSYGIFGADQAQATVPTGVTKSPASEVISYYNTEEADSWVQVTNTNFSTGAVIHIQILDEDCEELNFFDFLTPADTVTYHIDDIVGSGSRGMVVVNVTLAENDLVPISFPFLIGSTWVNNGGVGRHFNGLGRNLNGGVYDLIQPDNINAPFHSFDGDESEFISLSWFDEYNDGLGYETLGGIAFTVGAPIGVFIIDDDEGKDSCGDFDVFCISELGVTAGLPSHLDDDSGPFEVCDKSLETKGLVELIDLDYLDPTADNYTALVGMGDSDDERGGLDYAVVVGAQEIIVEEPVCGDDDNPVPVSCFEDICANNTNLCGTIGEILGGQAAVNCNDGEDNDGNGQIDCADFKCDGVVVLDAAGETLAVCEFGGELSCEDDFDNDNNGQTDCNDLACELLDICIRTSGSSSGCSVATATTGLGSMANALVLLIPAFGIGVRRIRRRLSK